MAHDVFISFSSKDQLVAEKLRDILEEQGIPCWMASREIIPGYPDWAAAITQAIQSSKALVFIHSENSNSSDQVLNEIHTADANHLNIITLKIDQTHFSPGLEYFLARRQIMVASSLDIEVQAKKLAKSIPTLIAGDFSLASRILRPSDAKVEPPADGDCPYKGLNYFDETDAGLFFGREQLVAKLVGHLRDNHFLAVVVGSSGSGKSSIVRAGMVPALRSGKPLIDQTNPPEGCTQWPIFIITPGIHPLDSLAVALNKNSVSVSGVDTLVQDFKNTPRALHLFIKKSNNNSNAESLIIVDQFEELFTLCQNDDERRTFIDNLISASTLETGGLVRVVITLRADFYSYCADFDNLREAVSQHQEYIGPMSQTELRRAIEEPAHKGNWQLESGLVDLLLREVGDEPGALPLLSHALLETWQRREGRWLTVRGYMESGGVKGAIARTAESVFTSLSEPEQKIARQLFLNLTELGEGTQDTRRRVSIEDLLYGQESKITLHGLIKKLTDSRLITTTESTIEVAHEALIREWPRLQDWLTEDRSSLRIHRRLSTAALEWQQMNKDDGLLYRGARLAEAIELTNEKSIELNEIENTFLAASIYLSQQEIKEHEDQQRKELESARRLVEIEKKNTAKLNARNRVISIVGLVALFAAIAAGSFGIYANIQKEAAQKQEAIANNQKTIAISNEMAAASRNSPFDLSVLLSQESFRLNDSVESVGALISSLVKNPYIIKYLRGNQGNITSLAISPDGKTMVSASDDRSLVFWNCETNTQIGDDITDHDDTINDIAFSPDGKTLISASSDSTLLLWNVSEQTIIGEPFIGADNNFFSVAFSPDGRYVASGDSNGSITFWGVETHEQIGSPMQKRDAVYSLQFSPDGRTLAAGYRDGSIAFWDTETNTEIGTPMKHHRNTVWSVAFSPDGLTLASASSDKTIILWDVTTQSPIGKPLTGHKNGLTDIVFSPDGKLLASSSWDNTVILWDVESQTQTATPLIGHDKSIQSLAFFPDGKKLASGDVKGTIIIWSITPEPIIGYRGDKGYQAITVSPDLKTVTMAYFDQIVFYDMSGDPPYHNTDNFQNTSQYFMEYLFYSSDGKTLITVGCDEDEEEFSFVVWDISSQKQLKKINIDSIFYGAAFNPIDQVLAIGNENGDITLWYLADLNQVRSEIITGHSDYVQALSYSSDGSFLTSVADDSSLIIWDTNNYKIIEPIIYDVYRPTSVAFTPDGKIIAVGEGDNTISLWDTATHEKIGDSLYGGHSDSTFRLAFNPDGNWLAAGSSSGEISLWDISTHHQIAASLPGHNSRIMGLIFVNNGNRMVSISNNQEINWSMDVEEWKTKACEIANRNLTFAEWKYYFPNDPYEFTCTDLEFKHFSMQQMLNVAHDAYLADDITTSQNMYQIIVDKAVQNNSSYLSNSVCWFGTLDGFPEEVEQACFNTYEQARLTDSNLLPFVSDTYALNLAMLGKTQEAIKYFEVFISYSKENGFYEDYGKLRETWVSELKSGKNPFDAETLKYLRNEGSVE